MRKHALSASLILLVGCATQQSTNGIPNFSQVSPGIYRGGQPTAQGWEYLHTLGVTNVLKLNTNLEGTDPKDFRIFYYPITFAQQMGFEELPSLPIFFGPPMFVHCSHGQDRTGLMIALHRMLVENWSKSDAEKEMLEHGFHKELRGLWGYWQAFPSQNFGGDERK